MFELDKCLDLRKKIQDTEEKIEELDVRIRFPKAQTMSDMPRSTSFSNKMEDYLVKKEKLTTKKLSLEAMLEMSWDKIKDKLSKTNATVQEIMLLRYRFYNGYSWKKCTAIMAGSDKKWNENKTFRVYRQVIAKLQNE